MKTNQTPAITEKLTPETAKTPGAAPFSTSTTWHASGNQNTIYARLKAKIGREPSDEELTADVKRILDEGLIERATAGKLPHQRKRR